MRLVALALAFVALGCSRGSHDTGSSQGSAPAPAPAPAPLPAATVTPPAGAPSSADVEKRARELLQRQLDAAKTKPSDLVATFTKDAVVIVDGNASTADHAPAGFGLGGRGPDGVSIDSAEISKLVAHGTEDAVWFYAEVSTHSTGPGGGPSNDLPRRVVELLTESAQWHAVAGSFGLALDLKPSGTNTEFPSSTGAAGQLGDLLGSPSELAKQLAPDAIVVGPSADQFATGSGAAAALASWKLEPLTMYKDAREAKGPAWGFAQAAFDRPNPKHKNLTDRAFGQLFAVPKTGSWQVVLVQYCAQ